VSLAVPALAGATPLAMDPGSVHVEQSDGGVLLWNLDWTFVQGETDGATTQLVLRFDYRSYQGEGGGTLLFDVPVTSPRVGSLGGGLFVADLGNPDAFTWAFLGSCCASTPGVISDSLLTEITFDLLGVPTSVEFAPGSSATFTLVPEPAPALAIAAGLAVLSALRRRPAGALVPTA